MNYRDGCRVKGLRAISTIWWWLYIYIYIYVCVCVCVCVCARACVCIHIYIYDDDHHHHQVDDDHIYIYIYNHQIVLIVRKPLTLHLYLSFIFPRRSTTLHTVSVQSWCMQVFAGRAALLPPCVGVHNRTFMCICIETFWVNVTISVVFSSFSIPLTLSLPFYLLFPFPLSPPTFYPPPLSTYTRRILYLPSS